MRRFARTLALALLAWLPLQAVALPGFVLACQLDPAHSPGPATDQDHGTEHQAHGDGGHAHDGDDGAGDQGSHGNHSLSSHPCCHLYSAAAPPPPLAAPAPHGEYRATAASHAYHFFPEQFQRPPLAAL